MGVDAAWGGKAHHVRQPGDVLAEQPLRHPARADDLLPVVEIVEERVERAHALFDPLGQLAPFARGDDARHHVERDQAFFRLVLAIDVEGDAGAAEAVIGFRALALENGLVLFAQPAAIIGVGRTHIAAGVGHLVEADPCARA